MNDNLTTGSRVWVEVYPSQFWATVVKVLEDGRYIVHAGQTGHWTVHRSEMIQRTT